MHWPWFTAWILVQLVPLGLFFTGLRTIDVVVCVGLFSVRMLFLTSGFHRFFAHRAYKVNRFWQFVIAFGGQTCAQRGMMWWVAHHRHHHRYSDTMQDTHTPLKGFWWSHCLWLFSRENLRTKEELIPDIAKYPELRFLDRYHLIPSMLLGTACFLIGGPSMLLGGFFLSTAILYHATFTINSLDHVWGSRRFVTRDTSRNNFFLTLLTFGEGWHNNHHHYPSSSRLGFYWWEIDGGWYLLKMLSWVGIVHDMRNPTAEALVSNRIKDGVSDIGMFQAYWVKAAGALGNKRARTGEFYVRRKKALEELVTDTKVAAEEIARMSKIQSEGETS